MSRSRRKAPIFGFTTCASERKDKQAWHRRWRRWERTALVATKYAQSEEALERHQSVLAREVSNPWAMGKDGWQWWPVERQQDAAEAWAKYRARTPQEQEALKKRLMRKWMAK